MKIVIQSLGIVFVAVAIVYLLKPDVMKRLMEFFKQGKRLYFAGILRFALAVVFLLAASQCRWFWVIFALGILFLISGLLIFALSLERLKSIIEWYQKRSVLLLRVLALITLVVGVVIIISA